MIEETGPDKISFVTFTMAREETFDPYETFGPCPRLFIVEETGS